MRIRLLCERSLGTEGYAICSGFVENPARRCLWRVVAKRKHLKDANKVLQSLPADQARALFFLDTKRLLLINRKGDTVQDNMENGTNGP